MNNTSWSSYLAIEQSKPYYKQIITTLEQDKAQGHTVHPPSHQIFKALDLTPLTSLKVLILGQDPYHGPGEANGLAFSVSTESRIPPSLRNIYKELMSDLGLKHPTSGDLSTWATQGVLLLNTSLSVQHKKPLSHAHIGWQQLTDQIISIASQHSPHLVFILWGAHAQSKISLIDSRHYVIKSPHPSPLSAYRGFFGSKPFSKTNNWLEKKGLQPINWQLD
jgi:uracil-DNA glycosylase